MPAPRSVSHARRPERRLPLGAPPRAWVLAGWALLPLRAFLGVTFLFAGLQKLANPNFFNGLSPISIKSQLIAAVRLSPIHALLSHLLPLATPIGIVIALGEVAIGLGALLGLWMRVAAIGGALLSLMLFLTVSFHAAPYYTGADIVFFFAWLPFIAAGAGSRFSLDGGLARRAAAMEGAPPPDIVTLPFAQVQRFCGQFNRGRCNAREGLLCEPGACPVLLGPRAPYATRVTIDSVDRRALVLGGATATLVAGAAVVLGGVDAVAGRVIHGTTAPTAPTQLGAGPAPSGGASPTTTTTTAGSSGGGVPGGTLLGKASQVPVGQAASFTIPSSGDPGIVVQPSSGVFDAYDAVCPHAGCTVGYYAQNQVLACPCHGSQFALSTGQVISGPAPHGLLKLNVVEGSDGNLYLK